MENLQIDNSHLSVEEEIEELKPQVDQIKEKLAIAEAILKASMLTPLGASARLAVKKMQIEGCSDEYVPPRAVLLYLVRMGSFCSTERVNNTDHEDNNFSVPKRVTRAYLLELCRFEKLSPFTAERRLLRPRGYDLSPYEPSESFRVLQWNILSQTLGLYCDKFVSCPTLVLNWRHRKYNLIEELLMYHPDIICLQEVDHYKFLQTVLDTQGYSGCFFEKPDSPCLYMEQNNGPDGCAIFYHHNVFEVIDCHKRHLNVWNVRSNQVAIFMNLRHLRTGKEVCLATTHLKAHQSALLQWIRNAQARDLVSFTKEISKDRPIIITGDFNGDPTEPFYNTMCTFQNIGLESTYSRMKKIVEKKRLDEPQVPNEFDYTSWTVREHGDVIRTIDYIFYTPHGLRIQGILEIPRPEEVEDCKMPSLKYPSDHLSLMAEFKFNYH